MTKKLSKKELFNLIKESVAKKNTFTEGRY